MRPPTKPTKQTNKNYPEGECREADITAAQKDSRLSWFSVPFSVVSVGVFVRRQQTLGTVSLRNTSEPVRGKLLCTVNSEAKTDHCVSPGWVPDLG